MTDDYNLGACCACRKQILGGALILLPWKGEIPGHGWGCVVCGLPPDGATVALCDECADKMEDGAQLESICVDECRGYPETEGRRPLSPLSDGHRHNFLLHPERDY